MSHKSTFVRHHSHNHNRFDVFETFWAGKFQKGMGFGTDLAYIKNDSVKMVVLTYNII